MSRERDSILRRHGPAMWAAIQSQMNPGAGFEMDHYPVPAVQEIERLIQADLDRYEERQARKIKKQSTGGVRFVRDGRVMRDGVEVGDMWRAADGWWKFQSVDATTHITEERRSDLRERVVALLKAK